jgi:hypothetical protein
MRIENQKGYATNPAFSGGEVVVPVSGSTFAETNRGYGSLYVGKQGDLVVKTVDGSVLTFVSASGFIYGGVNAVSASSTAASILGFDAIPTEAVPTTTTAAPTTTVAPTTTIAPTTTAAP